MPPSRSGPSRPGVDAWHASAARQLHLAIGQRPHDGGHQLSSGLGGVGHHTEMPLRRTVATAPPLALAAENTPISLLLVDVVVTRNATLSQ